MTKDKSFDPVVTRGELSPSPLDGQPICAYVAQSHWSSHHGLSRAQARKTRDCPRGSNSLVGHEDNGRPNNFFLSCS